MADGSNPQIEIEATINPTGAVAGGAQVSAAVRQVGETIREENAQTEAAAAAQAQAAQIAQEYGVSLETASQALAMVARAGGEAAIGSAELEAALETVQREAAAAAEATGQTAQAQLTAMQVSMEYGTSLEVSSRALAMLAEANVEAVLGSVELETALGEVQRTQAPLSAAQMAYNEQLRATAAASMAEAQAEAERAAISEVLAAALQRLGIAEAEVAAMAEKTGRSMEVVGRAMVQLKQAAMAAELAATRSEILAIGGSSLDTAAALASVGKTAEEAGEKGASSFGRGSPFFHAMVAANNVSRGGAMEMRGIFEAVELASFALPGMIGPLLLLGATGYEVFEHLQKRTEETDKSTEKLRASIDKTTDAIIRQAAAVDAVHLEVLNTKMKQFLDYQKALISQQSIWDEHSNRRLQNLQAELEAQQKLALAQLEQQRQVALNGATSDAQREAINAKFDVSELRLKGAQSSDLYAAQKKALAADEQQTLAEITTRHQTNVTDSDALKALQNAATGTSKKVTDEGFQADEAGSFKNAITAQEAIVKKAAETAAEAINKSPEDVRIRNWELAQEGSKLADLRDAENARQALQTQGAELTASIKENSSKIEQLGEKLDDLASKGQVLDVNHRTDQINLGTEADTKAKAATNAEMEANAADRAAWRQQQITLLQQKIEATADKVEKDAWKKVIEGYEGMGIRDKATIDFATGKISRAQYDEQMTKGLGMITAAGPAAMKQLQPAPDKPASQAQAEAAQDTALNRILGDAGSSTGPDAARHLEELRKEVENLRAERSQGHSVVDLVTTLLDHLRDWRLATQADREELERAMKLIQSMKPSIR